MTGMGFGARFFVYKVLTQNLQKIPHFQLLLKLKLIILEVEESSRLGGSGSLGSMFSLMSLT